MVLKNKNVVVKTHSVKTLPESFVVIDFETTSFDPTTGRIIEIGAVRFTLGEPVALFNTMVKQDVPIPEEVTKITGHTSEDVAKGIDEEKAMVMLFQFISDSPIVGQNILFDFEFMTWAMRRNWDYVAGNDAVAVDFTELEYELYDTLTIGRDRKPYPHRLADLCTQYNVEQENWHSAYYDALATGYLFLAMHAEDKNYPEGKQVADYKNVIGYKNQYGVPKWYPAWVTLKGQGSMHVNENGKGGK